MSFSKRGSNPPARGVRVDWDQLPEHVRRGIEGMVGGEVVEAVTQPGGFSPGLAARLRLGDDAVLCSLAGYFVVRALDPPPPGIPTVRAFQAAQGRIALDWLQKRLGW